MAKKSIRSLAETLSNQRRKHKWNKVVTVLAAVVVFCTTYALILPAITMEREPLCGLEIHEHTDECYQTPMELTCSYQQQAVEGKLPLVVHRHNEFCYDAQGNLVCALPEVLEHEHTDECYEMVPSEDGHRHTDGCYEDREELTCELEEAEGHAHTDECGKTVERTLTCTKQEGPGHTHTAECEEVEKNLICTQQESTGHTHTAECEDEEGNLICGQEESEGHTHTDECYEITVTYTCGQDEYEAHEHTDACFEETVTYGCGQEESEGHAHDPEACYTVEQELICGEEEPEPEKKLICTQPEIIVHVHGPECLDEEGNLICELQEVFAHVHGPECWTPVPGAEPLLICGKEEHKEHTNECYTDETADVETPEIWESTLPKTFTGNWDEDVLAVAYTQLGYQESSLNVVFTDDGNVKGYTRYGAWIGKPYDDWCAHFLDFCHHYAGLPIDAFPQYPGCARWCDKLAEDNFGVYFTPDVYEPKPGDTAFFDMDGNGAQDHVGIVEKIIPATEEEPAKLQTIEGNSGNCVQQVIHELDGEEILGYASIAAARERYDRLHPVYICGQAEHSHTEECYGEDGSLICPLEEHTHSAFCLKSTVYYCGQEPHAHGEGCYDEEGNLTCEKPEHTHSESCLAPAYYCGLEAHTHTEACKDPETGEYVCGLEEHTHDESCKLEHIYYCGKEEHIHGPECYDEEENLICTLEAHTHDAGCEVETLYYCGLVEHIHGETCYDENGNLTCTLIQHVHDEECRLEFLCGYEEHAHDETCSDENGNPICKRPAHTHDETCKLKKQSVVADMKMDIMPLSLDLEGEAPAQPSVTVEGFLPRGARVEAVPLDVEGMMFAYDITIYDNQGNAFEPLEGYPVLVKFFVPGITDNPNLELQAYHLPDASAEDVPAEEAPAEDSLTEEAPAEAAPTEEAPALDELDPLDTVPGGNGDLEVKIPHFSYVGIALLNVNIEDDCEITDTWYKWIPATNDNPFGSAQHYNVFLLGDLVGFNNIHGNAAIGGDIYGDVTTSIGRLENSDFNYEADATLENDISLILGGNIWTTNVYNLAVKRPAGIKTIANPIKIQNGTAVVKEYINTEADVDEFHLVERDLLQTEHFHEIRPQTHVHQVAEANNYKFYEFFRNAGMSIDDPDNPGTVVYDGTLLQHNEHVYQYVYELRGTGDPHMGSNYRIGDLRDQGKDEFLESVLGENQTGAEDDSFLLRGSNPFYNVFNLKSSKIAPAKAEGCHVFLDVPIGSYVVINILGRDENDQPITVVPNFGIQFWYRNTEGRWIQQPAEIRSMHGEGFNQSQMVLVNFEPKITDVTFCTGNYFQASILAPNANMHCDTVDLEGTIVFKSMQGDANDDEVMGNNNVVYSPFYTGTSMMLAKEMVCDTPNADHTSINGAGNEDCQIQASNSQYYADVKFNVSDTLSGSGKDAILKDLPIDGKYHEYGGLRAGYYTVADEMIYIKASNGGGEGKDFEYKERRLTVDEDGYWMVGMYLAPGFDITDELVDDPSANVWTYVYCDKAPDFSQNPVVCSIPEKHSDWKFGSTYTFDNGKGGLTITAQTDEQKEELLKDGEIFKADETKFMTFRHEWNYGLFRREGSSTEKPVLTVQANNPVGNVTLVNHYSVDPVKAVTVYKEWGEIRTVDVVVNETVTEQKEIFIPVTPPADAKIQVTLYRSSDDGATYTVVPAREATDEDPGLTNPVTLQGPANWSYMWRDLPEGTYKVEETSGWPGWETKTEADADQTVFVISNIQKQSSGLTVEKEWYNAEGVKLTDEEIAAYNEANPDNKLSSKVTLYQQIGQAPKDNGPFAGQRKYITVYLNETGESNRLGTIPYYPGSDLNVTLDLFAISGVYGLSDTTLDNGNLKEMELVLDGKKLETKIHCGTGQYHEQDADSIYNTKTFTSLIVSAHIDNLDGFPDLILKLSSKDGTYPILKEADIANIKVEANKNAVYGPKLMIDYTRYNPKFITWDDIIRPYDKEVIELAYQETKWTHVWEDLPKSKEGDPNTRYGYFVVEVGGTEGYNPTYIYSQTAESHDGTHYDENPPEDDGSRLPVPDVTCVNGGYIAIRNYPKQEPPSGPELPATGGMGTHAYTIGGALMSLSAVLLYMVRKRRKEVDPS